MSSLDEDWRSQSRQMDRSLTSNFSLDEIENEVGLEFNSNSLSSNDERHEVNKLPKGWGSWCAEKCKKFPLVWY